MNIKRGQIQFSFGMIFSILIIVATLLTAGYVIVNFVLLKDDASCKVFYGRLQERIDDVWKGEGASINTEREPLPVLPGKVKNVCFGNSTQIVLNEKYKDIYEEASYYGNKADNLFFSPRGSCGEDISHKLNHVKIEGKFCAPVVKGKVELIIKKEISESLVNLCSIEAKCGEET